MTSHNTPIEWTHPPGYKGETWNPIVGCTLVSPGCSNCYAMKVAGARLDGNPATPHYAGTTRASKAGRSKWRFEATSAAVLFEPPAEFRKGRPPARQPARRNEHRPAPEAQNGCRPEAQNGCRPEARSESQPEISR